MIRFKSTRAGPTGIVQWCAQFDALLPPTHQQLQAIQQGSLPNEHTPPRHEKVLAEAASDETSQRFNAWPPWGVPAMLLGSQANKLTRLAPKISHSPMFLTTSKLLQDSSRTKLETQKPGG